MRQKSDSKKTVGPRFALCLDSGDYEGSLSVGKIYPVLPDAKAAEVNYVRIVDDTGEDYLFHRGHFAFLNLPKAIRTELKAAYAASASNGNSRRAERKSIGSQANGRSRRVSFEKRSRGAQTLRH
jgi:hypothetical protein